MPASSEAAGGGLQGRGIACDRGDRPVFAGLDLEVATGAALLLQGPNGSGKTTLLRALAGLTEMRRGEVRWNGAPCVVGSASWRMQIAYAGHKSGLKDELSVEENFELARALDGGAKNADERVGALQKLGLGRRAGQQVKRLSQGQKQRLTLARLSLSRRPLWLLDEPAAALDAEARSALSDILCQHLDRGGVAVIATHDRIELCGRRGVELCLS